MKNHLVFAQTTNPGSRKVNEDTIGAFTYKNKSGFAVCDGLGGHGLGDLASQIFVSLFSEHIKDDNDAKNIIIDTFEDAQQNILAEQKARGATNKIKTTAVLAVADEKKLLVGHIGDSRLYIFKGNKVFKRTLDHSIPQMLVMSKEISEKDIRNHPDRNMLLKVVGTEWKSDKYDLMKAIPLKNVQAVLMCTDGFWEFVDEDCMCKCLKDALNVQNWLDSMERIVLENGKGTNMDNFSAIAIWNERK